MAASTTTDLVPEIGTRAITTYFRYFERQFGLEKLKQAVVRIGGEPTLDYLLDPENFVSLDYLLRAAQVLTEEAGDPQFLRRAGEHQFDDPRMLGFAYYFARSLGSPQLYYRMAVKSASTFNRVCDVFIEELTNRRLVFRYRSLKPESTRMICEGRIGQLASVPRLWGMPLAEARELECQVLGAPACRYELTWTPKLRPVLHGILGGAAGFATGFFGFGSAGALPGAALGALATLAITYRQLARERTRQALDSSEASSRSLHEAQRRFEEVQKLHSALAQAQKLEAIGRLSGGIAHDFNNMLTVILSSAQVAKRRPGVSDAVGVHLDAISDAAQRAADLTRRLLAFARQQIVEPRVIGVGEHLTQLEPMLRRLVGEDIRVDIDVAAEPLNVLIDPTQLEQVFVNLAANARDAMPNAGTLCMSVKDALITAPDGEASDSLAPGEYVEVRVSDSGSGMDEATRQRAFDPFFTTKEVGKGTGFGLATCYGIVRQAGGSIALESEPGQGTVVVIRLPRVREAAAAIVAHRAQPVRKGSETVLVAEDDAGVRRLMVSALTEAGYRVIEASSGAEAIALAAGTGEIHLLVSDVVMPELDGRTLSDSLREQHPQMRTLFVSGYSNEVISSHGVLAHGVELLRKPFAMDDLLAKARAVLDATERG